LAKADELGFNALIKPILDENEVDNQSDNQIDNQIDNKIDSNKDIQSDIPKDIPKDKNQNNKKADKKSKNTTTQKDIKKDISKSPMDIFLASKKKKIIKKFVGLHLPSDVDDALTQFKKDNDIDKSEVVAMAVRLFLKDYFDNSEEGAM